MNRKNNSKEKNGNNDNSMDGIDKVADDYVEKTTNVISSFNFE